jgi:hypothetical protein
LLESDVGPKPDNSRGELNFREAPQAVIR